MINFDNSKQINIKFTFAVYDTVNVLQYMWCVYCNTVAPHAHDGHTGFTFK